MKQVSPWSVKGVGPEAREAAKTAARKAGTTIGAWLTQAILSAAAEGLGTASADRSDATLSDTTAGLPQAGPPVPLPQAPLHDEVVEQIQGLGKRYMDLEERLSDTLEPMMRKVRRLSLQMEEVRYLAGRVEDLAVVHDKIRDLQRISLEVEKIRDLQDQIYELRRNSGGLEKIRELEDRVRELQRDTGESEKIRELEQNLTDLMHCVENMAETRELSGSGEGFDHLAEMIEEAQRVSQQQIAKQAARTDELANVIEEIKSQAATQTGIGPVERAITRLAERVQKLEEGTAGGKGGLFG